MSCETPYTINAFESGLVDQVFQAHYSHLAPHKTNENSLEKYK
jgi:hypothetical protein